MCPHLSCAEEFRIGSSYSRWSLVKAEQRGRITCPDLLPTLLLMQPRIQLAAWGARTHYWVMSNFLSMGTSKSFSSKLLDMCSSPSHICVWDCLVQLLGLVLFQLLGVLLGLLLKFSQVLLGAIPSFRCVSCTVQLHVICQHADCALDLTVHVIDEDIEEDSSQDRDFSPACSWALTTTLWPSWQFLIH